MDSSTKAEVQSDNRKYWLNEQREWNGIEGFESFSYAQCSGNVRGKRSIGAPLSSVQEGAIEAHFDAREGL